MIWTPAGFANTERPTVTLNAQVLAKLAILAEVAGEMRWGLHCSNCGQDVSGKNARADNNWQMECGCRTYVGANPLPKAG